MGRIRTIKPEFFTHGELFDAEYESGLPLRLAFAGLWTQCDRKGRFKWKPRELKLQILPYDPTDFSCVLDALEAGGFIVSYTYNGDRYGYVPSFLDHQQINNKEQDSRLPSPEEGTPYQPVDATTTRERRDNDANGTPLEGKGKEGKGKEGKKDLTAKDKPSPDSRFTPFREDFEKYFTGKNHAPAPWDGQEGAHLSRWLKKNPTITQEQWRTILNHRNKSPVAHGESLSAWIARALSWLQGPADTWGKAIGGSNGANTGNSAAARVERTRGAFQRAAERRTGASTASAAGPDSGELAPSGVWGGDSGDLAGGIRGTGFGVHPEAAPGRPAVVHHAPEILPPAGGGS